MLALATTTATVTRRAAAGEDAHGAPLPGAEPATLGPWRAHRKVGTSVLTDSGAEVRGCTWYLEPAAWPVVVGDTISDDRDATEWTVQGAQLVPSGLGLDQVQAYCSQVQPEAAG